MVSSGIFLAASLAAAVDVSCPSARFQERRKDAPRRRSRSHNQETDAGAYSDSAFPGPLIAGR